MSTTLKSLSAAALILSATQVFTASMNPGHFLFELGGYNSTQGREQDIAIEGLIGDRFTLTDRHDVNALFGLGYFLNGMKQNQLQMDLGVNAFYLARTEVSGTIVQEQLFTNLGYSYEARHIPVYAAAKATLTSNTAPAALTLDAGIGPNFIRTSNYNDWSLDGMTLPDNAFLGHSKITISAMAGIGLKLLPPTGKMPLECGYRFFYLGQGHLVPRSDQIHNTLQTGTNYANALLCTVTV